MSGGPLMTASTTTTAGGAVHATTTQSTTPADHAGQTWPHAWYSAPGIELRRTRLPSVRQVGRAYCALPAARPRLGCLLLGDKTSQPQWRRQPEQRAPGCRCWCGGVRAGARQHGAAGVRPLLRRLRVGHRRQDPGPGHRAHGRPDRKLGRGRRPIRESASLSGTGCSGCTGECVTCVSLLAWAWARAVLDERFAAGLESIRQPLAHGAGLDHDDLLARDPAHLNERFVLHGTGTTRGDAAYLQSCFGRIFSVAAADCPCATTGSTTGCNRDVSEPIGEEARVGHGTQLECRCIHAQPSIRTIMHPLAVHPDQRVLSWWRTELHVTAHAR
jgi:hypothetical protein